MNYEALIRQKIKETYKLGDIIFSDQFYKKNFIDVMSKKTFMNYLSVFCKNTVSEENGQKNKELSRLGKGVYYSSFDGEKYHSIRFNSIIDYFIKKGKGVVLGDYLVSAVFNTHLPETLIIYTTIIPRSTMSLTENIPNYIGSLKKIKLNQVRYIYFTRFRRVLTSILYILENSEMIVENLNYDIDLFYEILIDYYKEFFYFPSIERLYDDLIAICNSFNFKKKTLANLQDFINYMYYRILCLNRIPLLGSVDFQKAGLIHSKTTYDYYSKQFLKDSIKKYKNDKGFKKLKKRIQNQRSFLI